MLYSLDIYIVTDNENIITAIKNKIPEKLSAQVWEFDYMKQAGLTDDGFKFISGEIKFKNEADRQVAFNWIKNKKDQVIDSLEDDSFLQLHNCPHRKQQEGTATESDKCVITWKWTKRDGVVIP